jgi:hypothetical protein
MFKSAHLEMGDPMLLTGAVREYYEALHHMPHVDVDRILACMAPGCPDTAAKYAVEDASVDHGMAQGTMAAAFVAAVESAAFVVKDLRRLIEIGFTKIPADSRVARAVKVVCDCYDQGIGWKEARQKEVSRKLVCWPLPPM